MNMNSRNVTYSKVGDYLLPNLTLPAQEDAGQVRQAAPDVPDEAIARCCTTRCS